MAAAYAAVVSIVHLMDQIQSYQARRPIFLDEQLKQIENIQHIVIFLQDFLEVCPHESIEEAEGLRVQITVAARAIEYIIESHIVDDIHSQTQQQYIEKKMNENKDLVRYASYWKRSSDDFSQRLQRVIEDMEDIKREVKLFKEKLKLEDHQPRDLAPFAPLGRPHFVFFNVYMRKLLSDSESWSLLCKMIFFPKDCPPELEEVGKKIAESCKGLPLSIAVIGGLLANSNMTCAYWKTIADDINMIVESDVTDRALSILSLIYNHLPVHLKPCILYMGFYTNNQIISVSELIKLWVAEGFLKPHRAKTMEEVANDYLNDLIDRNLISVTKFGSNGNKKFCKTHSILRMFCHREAHKERDLCATKVHSPNTSQKMNNQHRVSVPLRVLRALHSSPGNRSFTCNFKCDWPESSLYFKLPGDMNTIDSYSEELQLVNSRYLSYSVNSSAFTSSLYLWNIQTLIISKPSSYITNVPFEIWEMLQLRHLNIVGVTLSDPPCQMGKVDAFVLENLQSLSLVRRFRCTEEALKRLPNIKKLKICYPESRSKKELSHYCLNNLGHLHKLQSLYCSFRSFNQCQTQNINFPDSLKKLTLKEGNFDGEGITAKIGSLPHLENLVLISCYIGKEWNPIEQQFLSLKSLKIYDDDKLVEWTADSTHFPCLEFLLFYEVSKLKEIPSGIGKIETLRSMHLNLCTHSVVASAEKILEEQQSIGNKHFLLVVREKEEEEEEEDDDEL